MTSLRVRLLLVGAAVALIAVSATALIAQQVANNDLRRALDQEYEVEAEIFNSVEQYVVVNQTWQGIDGRVEELAFDLDKRIVITDEFGRVIADSQPGREIPGQPVGYVDSLALVAKDGDGSAEAAYDEILMACDETLGITADSAWTFDDLGVEADSVAIFGEQSGSFDPVDEARLFNCIEDALAEMNLPPSALVFVGSGTSGASIIGQDGPNAALIGVAALVTLAALAAMVVAARPILSPINDLHQGATQLGQGDLNVRVPQRGARELVELSKAFNTMADSLQRDEDRRQQWTSDVAHELRSPLQNLRGQLEAAQDNLMPADDRWFDSILDEVGHLSYLVEDLQTLTLTDTGRLPLTLQSSDLGALAAEVVATHRARAEQLGIDLTSSGSAVAQVDQRRIRQVLGNLVDNALRYTPTGGSVTLAVTQSSDWASITVTDTGIGIPSPALATIFDRFARIDADRNRSSGGSGLGLAIVAGIVEAHQGTITAQSQPGAGTSFIITLPTLPTLVSR